MTLAVTGVRGVALGVAMIAALVDATAPARAADAPAWTVDPAKSRISFTGKQMGVPSQGRFKTFAATVRFDPENLAASTVEVTIDTASADAGNSDIEKELKRPNWFDTARFPKARFVTAAFRAKGGKTYEASARLTLRDVTKDVVLPFDLDIGPDAADPSQLMARAAGEVSISRTAFGIGQNEWRHTTIVGDEVRIRVDIIARRKK